MTRPTDPTPALLATGDIILGAKDRREWEVIGNAEGEVHLERTDSKGRRVVAVVPHSAMGTKVTLIATAAQVAERAEALAQVRMGGVVLARTDSPDGISRTPATFVDPGSLLAHIFVFHIEDEVRYPEGDFDAIKAAHAAMHEVPTPVPHVHDPDFYQEG